MKQWFKKLFIPSGEQVEITAYRSWIVRWHSRYDEYSADTRLQAEIFPSEQDAIDFANQLRAAFNLLRYSGRPTKVTVEENQNNLATLIKK